MVEAEDWMGLPAELLVQVFQLLPLPDLRSGMLVCRRWGEAGGLPSVCASKNILVTRNNLAAMPRILASPRLMLVKKLTMSAVSTKMFKALAAHPGIRKVDMEDASLSEIQPKLLAQALTNLEQVNLTGTQLSFDQNIGLCSSLLDGSIRLKSLSLAWNDLSWAEPQLLAEAVSKVEDEIDLRNSCLTARQIEAIFEAFESSGQPKKVCLRHNDISEADAEVLGRGAAKVEGMDLRHTSLTLNQAIAILEHSLLDTNLKKIYFGFVEVFSRGDKKLLIKLILQTKFPVDYAVYHVDFYSGSDNSDEEREEREEREYREYREERDKRDEREEREEREDEEEREGEEEREDEEER